MHLVPSTKSRDNLIILIQNSPDTFISKNKKNIFLHFLSLNSFDKTFSIKLIIFSCFYFIGSSSSSKINFLFIKYQQLSINSLYQNVQKNISHFVVLNFKVTKILNIP